MAKVEYKNLENNVLKPKVALVLSTGAARGIAHIGVIEELERQGYEISSIAGCSMGALIGAAYATGNLHKCKEFLCGLNNRQLLSLIDLTLSNEGILKGDRIMRKLGELIPDRNIEDLPIPYVAVSTNIQNDQEVVFNHGSLHAAIRASISLPFLFIPFKKEGMTLIDGGISNPLPLSRVKRSEGDLLVAVVACTPKEECEPSVRLNKFALISEAMTSVIQRLIQSSILQHKPDVIIRIATRKYSLLNLKKSQELIRAGILATRNNMPECSQYSDDIDIS